MLRQHESNERYRSVIRAAIRSWRCTTSDHIEETGRRCTCKTRTCQVCRPKGNVGANAASATHWTAHAPSGTHRSCVGYGRGQMGRRRMCIAHAAGARVHECRARGGAYEASGGGRKACHTSCPLASGTPKSETRSVSDTTPPSFFLSSPGNTKSRRVGQEACSNSLVADPLNSLNQFQGRRSIPGRIRVDPATAKASCFARRFPRSRTLNARHIFSRILGQE